MKALIKVLTLVLAVFILINVGSQIYIKFFNPYQTEVVYESSEEDVFECEGIAFRNETVLSAKKSGEIKYNYANASKIAVGSNIALIYKSAGDIESVDKIAKLDEEIKLLEDCQEPGVIAATHIDTLSRQLRELHLSYLTHLENGEIKEAAQLKTDFLKILNKQDIITGKVKNFNSRINALKKERSTLQKKISSPKTVKADKSGYFANLTDGNEKKFNIAAAEKLTAISLSKMISDFKQDFDSGSVGKVITDPDWQFAVLIDSAKAMTLNKGQIVTIRFGIEEAAAEIERIELDITKEQNLVVFSLREMSPDLSVIRKSRVEIITGNKTGLFLPKSAVRIEDGQKGAYTVYGNKAVFKKIDVIIEKENYVLCAIHNEQAEYLQQYDDVITKGKDLHDGKRLY